MLMNLYRCRVVLMVLALLVACLQAGNSVAMASPLHVLGGEGVVIGHIDRYSGLPLPGGPEYSAGIVTVLRGQITWISQGHGNRKPVFPRRVAGKARVTTYGSYRFVLPPGPYVFTARLPHSNAAPFVQVIVKRGVQLHFDIPNICK